MKKKGFTLIELLAVIVILAIIMVIAVPKIIDVIESSRKSAAKSSAELYVEAIELKTAMGSLNSNKYPDKDDYLYDEIKVDIKGEGPTSGNYSLKNGKVVSGNFCVNGYEVVFQNRKATVLDKCPEGGVKKSGFIKLSSTSGNYIFPTPGTFEVEENLSGGTLSCTSSAEEVATCSVSGTTVTVTPSEPKSEAGYAILTIKSDETEKYNEASASYVVTTAAKLSVTTNGYEGSYDGQEHGITVTCSDATITYGMTEGIYDLTENPKFIDAGNYTVYYKIEKEGYVTATGSETVIITKLNGNLTLPSESGEIVVGKNTKIIVSDATGDITCESSNTSLATCSVSGTTITINGLSFGEALITINVSESLNYSSTEKLYSVVIRNKTFEDISIKDYVKMTPTSTNYNISTDLTGYDSVQTINPSELNLWRVIRINSDGTIEMVSAYASSVKIYFKGQSAYKKYSGSLNTIVKQYANNKYTIATRPVGYKGQLDVVNATLSAAACGNKKTSNNTLESVGCGEILYTSDFNLLKSYQLHRATVVNGSNIVGYWLGSRSFSYNTSTWYSWGGRAASAAGDTGVGAMYTYDREFFDPSPPCYTIRPIVTLKSGLTATGTGTRSDPFVLQ